MSNYRRAYVYGGTYFITAVLQDRRCDWPVRYIHEFREVYRETLRHCPFETVAITVFPTISTLCCGCLLENMHNLCHEQGGCVPAVLIKMI